jgi:predicted negative regulator of RcsB-dependent stress response
MINIYLNEHEQWIAVKKWWQRYNGIVLIVFSLVLLSASGIKYWNWHQEKNLQQASNIYEQMMLATSNHQPKLIKRYAMNLVKNYPSSIYADAARLTLAKVAVSNNEFKEALKQLTWVAENSKTSELADVAKIRLARLWLVNQKYKKALAILKGMSSKAYLPLVDELKGDIYTSMNQFDKAVDYYRKALTEVQDYGVGNLFLEMKSNDLSAISSQHHQLTRNTDKKKNG